jgi:phage-related protein
MKRKITAFGNYYNEFIKMLNDKEVFKLKYILSLLETTDRMPVKFIKFIRDGLYELRMGYNNNIYRIFFIFDDGNIVVLFNGFQKKHRKHRKTKLNRH